MYACMYIVHGLQMHAYLKIMSRKRNVCIYYLHICNINVHTKQHLFICIYVHKSEMLQNKSDPINFTIAQFSSKELFNVMSCLGGGGGGEEVDFLPTTVSDIVHPFVIS